MSGQDPPYRASTRSVRPRPTSIRRDARYPNAAVVAIDVKPEYVADAAMRGAREHLTNLTFQEGDVRSLPIADASVDLIWSKYVLYYLQQPDLAVSDRVWDIVSCRA